MTRVIDVGVSRENFGKTENVPFCNTFDSGQYGPLNLNPRFQRKVPCKATSDATFFLTKALTSWKFR